MPRRAVEIDAYDPFGKSVFRHIFSNREWYENVHPIIDSDKERVRLNISHIEGVQYDANGDVVIRWSLTYGDTGALAEERVWRQDGPTDYTRFSEPS